MQEARKPRTKKGRGSSPPNCKGEWSHECDFADKSATVTPRYKAIVRLTLFASTPRRAAHKLLIEIPRSGNNPMTTR
jgi:hypothetical protein